MDSKTVIEHVARGGDYYFRFKTIDIIKNGQLVIKLNESNCDDSTSTFRKGGLGGGIVTTLDFYDDGMEKLQAYGIFRGMESGFDFYLLDGWRWIANAGPVHAIAYDIKASGIDKLVLVATDEAPVLQIFTTNGYIVQLADPMIFNAC